MNAASRSKGKGCSSLNWRDDDLVERQSGESRPRKKSKSNPKGAQLINERQEKTKGKTVIQSSQDGRGVGRSWACNAQQVLNQSVQKESFMRRIQEILDNDELAVAKCCMEITEYIEGLWDKAMKIQALMDQLGASPRASGIPKRSTEAQEAAARRVGKSFSSDDAGDGPQEAKRRRSSRGPIQVPQRLKDAIGDDSIYYVEGILDHNVDRASNTIRYKVRWAGYGSD